MAAVLLVEDELDIREDLAYLIENHGHRVETAANGREALQKLHALEPPCMIVLDLMMPLMDGWTFRAELLKDPALATVPVVLISGVTNLQKEAASLDAVGFVPKPIDLDKLYALIDQHCC